MNPAAQRRSLLKRGKSLGYSGDNLGQLMAVADSAANGSGNYTARQRRTGASISSAISSLSG